MTTPAGQERPTGQGFSFRSGVNLINVTATVTDEDGRIAAIGFRTVELYGFEDKAQEYADLLGTHGLTASSVHARLLLEDPVRILSAARIVGAPFVIEPATLAAIPHVLRMLGTLAGTGIVAAGIPAFFRAEAMTRCWPSGEGAVNPALTAPSLLTAPPRITA